jgi:nitrite reductase/ring-hydroxylating ferredoxin subunit
MILYAFLLSTLGFCAVTLKPASGHPSTFPSPRCTTIKGGCFEEKFTMADMNRRDFLAAAAAMATACTLCGSIASADDQPSFQSAKDLPPEKFDAGKPDDYPKDKGSDKFALDHQILISHADGKIIAMTAVCPHRKALLQLADNNQYHCPHHESRFTLEGDPTPKPNGRMGPAHDPLVHYAIKINDDHHIIVDTNTTFDKDKWDDAQASIDVSDKDK